MRRFGVFQFDPRTGELRKQGIKIRLEGQPVAILATLLERPGEMVTREELQKRLWPADTFVDFEHSLYAAIKRLRAGLNDSADAPRYVETLARRGYRFIAPVEFLVAGFAVAAGQTTPRGISETSSKRRHWQLWLTIVGGLLVIGLAAWGLREWRRRIVNPDPSLAIHSLAVLPLENLTGDPSQEYFADGMTDELITQLAKISSLRVISRTSVMRYKGTQKTLPEIARELSVDAVIEGTVARSAERVRVTAQAIRANPEKHLWAERYDRPLSDVVTLQGELAREIAQGIRIKLTPQDQGRLSDIRPINREAYEAFLKGRYFWSKRTEETTKKAIQYYEQAIEKDPNYALAFTGLADAYKSLALPDSMQEALPPNEAFPKAKAAANRALEIDDTLAEAHASLAHIKYLYDRDWSGAEKEFERSLALNPNCVNARQWHAFELMWMSRLDEARIEIKRAQELDPLSLVTNGIAAFILASAHQYDQAIEQGRKPLEMDPNFAFAHYRLGQIYLLAGKNAEAIPELEKAISLSGGSPRANAELGFAYARLGKRNEALKLLNSLKERSKLRYVSPFEFALIYGGLGQRDRALDYLERASEDRDPSMNLLKLSPAFSNLHAEPRFTELVRRVGLPP